MADNINPDHYKRLPVEAIEIIESMIAGAPDNKAAYLHGQAAKYDLRLWGKGKSLEDFLSDWGKHIWYALRLESHLLGLIEKQKADEQQKASDLQSLKDHPFGKLKEPAWAPKVGDWVRINAPEPGDPMHTKNLEDLDGHILQVVGQSEFDKRYAAFKSDHGSFYVLIDLLEPAEQPEATVEVTGEVTGEVKPPDGWRWLERGELIRNGDKPVKGDAIPLLWIGTPCCGEEFILRRNRFEVGEKVVHIPSKDILQVIDVADRVSVVDVRGSVSHYLPEVLAPYIEEAK